MSTTNGAMYLSELLRFLEVIFLAWICHANFMEMLRLQKCHPSPRLCTGSPTLRPLFASCIPVSNSSTDESQNETLPLWALDQTVELAKDRYKESPK